MTIRTFNTDSRLPLCVLGVVCNDRGLEIEKEMRAWLEPHFRLYEVLHDGTRYEQPALRYMQALCVEEQEPCLYLHTKGAFNHHSDTESVRKMWQREFTERIRLYFDLVNRPFASVACPFTGSDKTTWFNGFVANEQAMADIPPIEPNENRKVFERLFRGTDVNVIGVIRSDIERGERGLVTRRTQEAINQCYGHSLCDWKRE